MVLSSYSDADRLASLVVHSQSPDANLKLDNLARRHLLLLLVRVEWEIGMNALRVVDSTLGDSEDTLLTDMGVDTVCSLAVDLGNGLDRRRFEWKVEVHHVLAVFILLP